MSVSLTIPEADGTIPPTPTDAMDASLATLRANAAQWCATDVLARIELLRTLIHTTLEAAPAWTTAAAAAKGIRRDSPLMGEDWGSGPATTVRNLSLLESTLIDIATTGRPQPKAVRTAADGQVAVDVMPADRIDPLLFAGFTAEARLDRSVTEEQAYERMGRIYRSDHGKEPGVALVLGAGNVSSIGPMDALYQLLALDRVVLLKMNPVNAHLGPHVAAAFAPLVDAGFLRLAYGGADVGTYLTDHDEIDAIHVTGSEATYDAIVFGPGEEGARRKRDRSPRLDTPVSAELGNITPVIVVPGPWSERDLRFHGDNIASMLVNNGGFNCVASRVIVQHRAWAKRQPLLHEIRRSLREAEPREPYYPGARERWERFTNAHKQAEWFGDPDDDAVPFTLIPELDPDASDDIAFRQEAFCGVMGEVGLEAPRSVSEFLDAAVDFCNEQLWGTLAATILIHPRSLADPEVAAALDRAIDRLEYGSVVINHWAGAAYGFVAPPWGAYPGSDVADIQSGRGVVHNTYLLEDVEKTVVRGPFTTPMTPPWFHTHRTADRLLPTVARFTGTRDATLVPSLLWQAARG